MPQRGSPSADVPVQIVLRPYASAVPLAAVAFGVGNILASAFLFHWIPANETTTLGILLIAFVAPLELVPSILAFLSRDTGTATAFAIFGSSWLVLGLQLLVFHRVEPNITYSIFMLSLVIVLGILASVTFSGKPVIGVLILVAIVRDIAAALFDSGISSRAGTITAICGLVVALIAFYCAYAFLEEDIKQRLSPLTLRSGEARRAMEGNLADQTEAITREAGVRKQL